MIFIKSKTQAALVDPLKFVTVSFATIMPNNWAVGEAGEKKDIIQVFLSTSRNEIDVYGELTLAVAYRHCE